MYILPHLCMAKDFKFFKFYNSTYLKVWIFFVWLIGIYPLFFPPSNVFYYMSPFDNLLQNWFLFDALLFTFRGPKSKLHFIKWIFGLNSLTFIWMKK
jgi:hypothetical protein